eukprot:scaffold6089_cov298-Prasinococcus_capsulatus_cf.AAC.1
MVKYNFRVQVFPALAEASGAHVCQGARRSDPLRRGKMMMMMVMVTVMTLVSNSSRMPGCACACTTAWRCCPPVRRQRRLGTEALVVGLHARRPEPWYMLGRDEALPLPVARLLGWPCPCQLAAPMAARHGSSPTTASNSSNK